MGGLTSRAIARKSLASEASSRPKYYSAPSRTYSDVEQETQLESAIRLSVQAASVSRVGDVHGAIRNSNPSPFVPSMSFETRICPQAPTATP